MLILYLHGFGATLNGRKASCLRAHFGYSAVVEPPDPGFPYGKSVAQPILRRLEDRFRKDPRAFLRLLGPNRLAELTRIVPELADMFPRSVEMAQKVYNSLHPDIIVGSSLGGSVAMAMDSRHTPLVLIDPVWNPRIKPSIPADRTPIRGPVGKILASAVIATLRSPVARLSQFQVPNRVKPQAIILHSPHDRVVGLHDSHRLLRNSPMSADDPHRVGMDRVIDQLAAAGCANQKCAERSRFNDGRLIIIGKDHHNNEIDPLDRCNKDPHPHRVMIAAVRLLVQESIVSGPLSVVTAECH